MIQQLSIFVENEVGSLSKVTTILREQGINIRAIASFDSPEFGILRMIVSEPEKAVEALSAAHFIVRLTQVLAIELEDQPGNLDRVFRILADAGLDISYIYSFVLRDKEEPLMILNLSDNARGAQVLAENGVRVSKLS